MSSRSSNSPDFENWRLKNPVYKTVGLSQLKDEKCFEFCWIIKNFSKILPNSTLKSPEFDGGEVSNLKWYLSIELEPVDGEEKMSIYLHLDGGQNVGVKKYLLFFQFIFHINGLVTRKGVSPHGIIYVKDGSNWGLENFMEKPSSVQNDKIKIECKITLKDTQFIHKIIDSKVRTRNEDNFEKLRSDYCKILQRNEHSDFEILVQGETFKVHKAILSARSRVFSAMFSSQMQESQNSSVKIEDFDKFVIENMLEFIYTGKTVILKSNVQELLKISDKYDLPDLKSECENYLIEFLINFENCCFLLELADNFNAPKLKSEAIDFIIKFKKEVSETQLFQNMIKSNSSLGVEILMAEWDFLKCKDKDDSDGESEASTSSSE